MSDRLAPVFVSFVLVGISEAACVSTAGLDGGDVAPLDAPSDASANASRESEAGAAQGEAGAAPGQAGERTGDDGGVAARTTTYPSVDPWFYGGGINAGLPTFLAEGTQPGIDPVQVNIADAPNLTAAGHTFYAGLGDYSPACIQDDGPHCANIPNAKAWLEGGIDSFIATGAKYFYVDEPCFDDTDFTTGLSDACSMRSRQCSGGIGATAYVIGPE
jgi:hypothetical protein